MGQRTRSERMRPGAAKATRERKPHRLWVYGEAGIGKSTLASRFPGAYFMAFDDGQHELDALKMGFRPESFDEVLDAIHFLGVDEHPHKTLVIDLLEGVEALIHAKVVATHKNAKGNSVSNIDEFGFQDGYKMAVNYWRRFAMEIERLQDVKGMHVVFLSHETPRAVKQTSGEDYPRAEPNVHKFAVEFLSGWCRHVLRAARLVYAAKDSKDKFKGFSDGVRYLLTQNEPAHLAKSRTVLPPAIELDGDYLLELLESTDSLVEPLVAEINQLLTKVDENSGVYARVVDALDKAGNDTGELSRIRGKLKAMVDMNPPAEAGNAQSSETQEQGE